MTSTNSMPELKHAIFRPGNIPDGCFAFVVKGDNMNPSIREGDIVICAESREVQDNDLVSVVHRGKLFVKRYRVIDGAGFLTNDNPHFPAFRVNGDFKILGKVTESVRGS